MNGDRHVKVLGDLVIYDYVSNYPSSQWMNVKELVAAISFNKAKRADESRKGIYDY